MVSIVSSEKEYDNIVLFLQDKGEEVSLGKDSKYRLKKKSEHFILIDRSLFLKDLDGNHKRVFHSEQNDLMYLETEKFHKIHHYGMNRFEEACNQYFFKIPRGIIRKVVTECSVCLQSQPLKTKETQVHIVAERPMERLMIDLIDMKRYKSSNSEYAWILSVIDVYSKYAWAFPLKTKSASEVADTLESHFCRNVGAPSILQSDNGKEFINREMNTLCERFSILFKHPRPRNPKANGQVERFNQTLTRYLQKHIYEEEKSLETDSKMWLKHLDKVMYNYNLAKHSATKYTPFNLFLQIPGFNTVVNPGKDQPEVQQCTNLTNVESILDSSLDITNMPVKDESNKRTQIVLKGYFDRMDRNSLVHRSKYDINIGDKVIIAKDFDSNPTTKKQKLSSFFSKECVVISLLSNNRIKVKCDEEEQIVSLTRVKKI